MLMAKDDAPNGATDKNEAAEPESALDRFEREHPTADEDGNPPELKGIPGATDEEIPEGDEAEAAPDKPVISADLDQEEIDFATTELGLTAEQLAEVGDRATDLILATIDKKLMDAHSAAPTETNQQPAKTTPDPKPVQKKDDEVVLTDEDFKLPDGFDKEYDEGIVKALNGLISHVTARLKKLEQHDSEVGAMKEQFDGIVKNVSAAQARENERQFYELLASLGEDGHAYFGDVSKSRPKPGTPEYKNADAVAQTMSRIMEASAKAGLEPKSWNEVVRSAFHINHPEVLKKKTEDEIRGKLAARSGAVIPRGTNGRAQQASRPVRTKSVAAVLKGIPD